MIFVRVEGIKSEGRGRAVGNGWHDTDNIADAVAAELDRFHRQWDVFGHGAIVTYNITVAPEGSPVRTIGERLPLPVAHPNKRKDADA